MSKLTFKETNKIYLKRLAQFVPIVDRVHGANHPEFHQVRSIFEKLLEKVKNTGVNNLDLTEEFSELRNVTSNYTIPNDVCETFEAVYNMLEEIDKSYHS